MYLKSIEIRGFKSFADRTLLHFRDGITAVVGPNGSGKSNISDAVRWVLGEQRIKSLRGGKMEDVIFAGTEFRKPLGFAEVTLLLDNSEHSLSVPFSEVSITRRLYRSGESEYLINGTTCRLRDIQELFMDTGIGKEGYSIIGQGKIESILSGKMEERRALLEEAAGIVKYKSRKEEAEKKLENTEANLLRVQDILLTYEERLGPLEREKEKAESFLVLSKEQRGILLSLILSDLEEMEEEKGRLTEEVAKTAKACDGAKAEKNSLETRTQELEKVLEEKEERSRKLKEEYHLGREEFESLKAEVRVLTSKIEDRERSLSRSTGVFETNALRLQEEQEHDATLAEEIRTTDGQLEVVRKEIQAMEAREQALDSSLKSSEAAQRGLRDEEEDTEDHIARLQEEMREHYRERDTLLGTMENSRSIITNYEASKTMNLGAAEKTWVQLEELGQSKGALDADALKVAEAKAREMEALEALDNRIKSIDYEGRGLESQRALLKNLEEQYEGYTRSAKSLMGFLKSSQSRHLAKTHLVGEVVRPKAGYESALEAALGSQVSNIITDTDLQAKELIGLLREKSMGRATFLPRNVIRGKKLSMPQLKKSLLLGNLADLVEFQEDFQGIVHSLLGRIFVAKDMNDAVEAAREMKYSARIVTLAGDIINAGGAMTGGSYGKKSTGVFSRKKDLEDLIATMEELRVTRKAAFQSREAVFARVQAEKKTHMNLMQNIQEHALEITKLKERHQAYLEDAKRIEGIIQEAKAQLERRKSELEEMENRVLEQEQRIRSFREQKEKNRTYLQGLKEQRTREFQEFDALKSAIMEISVKEARIAETLSAKSAAQTKVKASLDRLHEERGRLQKEMELFKEEIHDARDKIGETKARIAILENFLKEREVHLDQLSMEEVKEKAAWKTLQGALKTSEEEYHLLDKELYRKRDALEKLQKEESSLINKINDEMNLTLAEAREERIPIANKDAFRKRLNELRRLIAALGHVNVGAIEEFREVSEHQRFLSGQKEDLEKAKGELKELALEMTLRMRALFTENFKVMNENFNDTFRSLFQGGQARLILGEGDILEAPIEISVQPPGKKLQNINLMSGGEKVLSAIALTFAILRMKPTPFCILDEIEAALDDANVYRFADFLSTFSRDTQFILITHRKGTMESADVLYGVTMEEKGISKIVSMDLSEVKIANA